MNGLRTKTNKVYKNANNISHEVIVLTETWLNSSIADTELLDTSFQIYRRDRHSLNESAKVGGGLLIAVKNSLVSTLVDDFLESTIEILCIKLKMSSGYLYVVAIYVPPNSKSEIYEGLCNCLDSISEKTESNDEIIVIGDFNLGSLHWSWIDEFQELLPVNASTANEFSIMDNMASLGLKQLNGVSNQFNKILDLVYFSGCLTSDSYVELCDSKLIEEDRHHPALSISLSLSVYNLPSNCNDKLEFNFKECNFNQLFNLLDSINWNTIFLNSNLDDMTIKFYNVLFDCFIEAIPLRKIREKQTNPPWFDMHVKTLKNKRNKAWVKFSKSRTDEDYNVYMEHKNEFENYTNFIYSEFIAKTQSELKSSPRNFWKYVDTKRKFDGYPLNMSYENANSHIPEVISKMFANYFKSAFADTLSSDATDNYSSTEEYSHLALINFSISEDSIINKILKLEDNISPGPDGLPAFMLKKCSSYLSYPLYLLFNESLKCSKFPTLWKYAYLRPVHKKGPKNLVTNYRPIAKLSVIPKLFESLVCDTLSFNCSSVLCENQHGFVKKKSTITNLLEFTTFCVDAFEKKQQVDCIFTDFSKAFDKLSHEVLLKKLTRIGLNENFLSWISSYLVDRYYCVMFKNDCSENFRVNSGVPQGSHLGPLLFVLFINDLPSVFQNSKTLFYADDVKIFRTINSLSDCKLLQEDLKRFWEWCCTNRLILNIDKCKSMSFTRKQNLIAYNYEINSSQLCKLSNFSDLGINLDPKLTFTDHYNHIIKRANVTLGFIKRFAREFEDPYVLKVLYISFVRPILEYGCIVWAPYYMIHINRIESVQRRFMRFSLRFLSWSDRIVLPPYSDRLKLINLPSLSVHREYLQLCFIIGIIRGSISSSVLDRLNFNVGRAGLRNRLPICVVFSRSNYGVNSSMNQLINIFNKNFHIIDSINDNVKSHKFKNSFFNQFN